MSPSSRSPARPILTVEKLEGDQAKESLLLSHVVGWDQNILACLMQPQISVADSRLCSVGILASPLKSWAARNMEEAECSFNAFGGFCVMGYHWFSICFSVFVDLALLDLWVRLLKSPCPLHPPMNWDPRTRARMELVTGRSTSKAPPRPPRPLPLLWWAVRLGGWREMGGGAARPAPTPSLLFHQSKCWSEGDGKAFHSQDFLSSADCLKWCESLRAKCPLKEGGSGANSLHSPWALHYGSRSSPLGGSGTILIPCNFLFSEGE